MTAIVYYVRWVWYGFRLPLSWLHTLLSFISKPGSRYIMGGLLAVVEVAFFEPIHRLFLERSDIYESGDPREAVLFAMLGGVTIVLGVFLLKFRIYAERHTKLALLTIAAWWGIALYPATRYDMVALMPSPDDPVVFRVVLGAGLATIAVAYWVASKALAQALGPFPPPSRPLPPRRELKARNRVIVPAPVRVAVPPLPPRQEKAEHDIRAALPSAVAALLRE